MSRGSAGNLWRGSAVALVAATAIQCTTPTSPQDGDAHLDVLAATAPAARVDLVAVIVDPDSIAVGGRATALAVVRDASGRILEDSRVAWTSGNPAVATVDRSSGAITGMAPGQTTIIASVKGRRGQTALTVLPRETPTPIPVTATLAIITQPGGSTSGALLSPQPVVHVIDDRGHRLTGYSGLVTASLASGQGTLSGTTSVALVDGIAAFTNLAVVGSGTFTLAFGSAGLTSVASQPFGVASGTSQPLVRIGFDGYASTAALLADCVTFDCVEGQVTSGGAIALDATVAPPGGRQSMRYAFTHPGNGCNSITVKRAFRLPQRRQEVWAEFLVRFSTNFSTGNSLCAPNAHKLIFGDTEADQSGRWALHVGNDSPPNNTVAQELPYPNWGDQPLNQNGDPLLLAKDLWDGNWHTIRLHIRHSSSATSNDGVWEIWVDGVRKHRQTGFNTLRNDGTANPDYITGFSFAHNKDDGPPDTTMFLWWGPITVFGANPGW